MATEVDVVVVGSARGVVRRHEAAQAGLPVVGVDQRLVGASARTTGASPAR